MIKNENDRCLIEEFTYSTMTCPIVITSGAKKNHVCGKPLANSETTCLVHKNRASEVLPTILPCTLEGFYELVEEIATGDFERDAVIDLIDRYPIETLAPFGIKISLETESLESIFCRLYRWTHPTRSMKIKNGVVYLSDPHPIPTLPTDVDLPVMTIAQWKTFVKTLTKREREQLKVDLTDIDVLDLGQLLVHYGIKLDGFRWDTATIYRIVMKSELGQ